MDAAAVPMELMVAALVRQAQAGTRPATSSQLEEEASKQLEEASKQLL